MKRLFFRALILLSLFTAATTVAKAQQFNVDPFDTAFNRKYAFFDLKGSFAAVAGSDERNNYFLLDFSLLADRFTRIYFMNLSFKHPEIVNVDPDIAKNRIWFLASVKYPEKQILDLLSDLKKQAAEAANRFSLTEQAKWLKENDKYKQ